MTYGELKHYIGQLQASGYHVVPYMVQLQRKVAFPFVTLVMTLIAVPFAVTTGRSGAIYGVGAGIVLALVYWTMLSIFGDPVVDVTVRPWSTAALTAARHACDLQPDGRIHLHLDAAHHGLGSASCGPPVPAWHTLAAVPASFTVGLAGEPALTVGLAGQGGGGGYHGPFGTNF